VVLWVEVGPHRILLGADLETASDHTTGWSAVLDGSEVVSDGAAIFKVPHHGSATAHDDRVWTDLLSDGPVAILSPFSRGKQFLPTSDDVERITALTPCAYTTAPPGWKKHHWSDKVVRDSVKEATTRMNNVFSVWGHIRLRKKITEAVSDAWGVELLGDACRLS